MSLRGVPWLNRLLPTSRRGRARLAQLDNTLERLAAGLGGSRPPLLTNLNGSDFAPGEMHLTWVYLGC